MKQNTERYIQDLLIRGASQLDAGRIAGVTPGYVSQLMGTEAFRQAVQAGKAGRGKLAENSAVGSPERAHQVYSMYMDMELALLEDLQQNMVSMKMHDKLKLLQAISQKKQPAPVHVEEVNIHQTIVLQLPAITSQRFQVNNHNDIVSLGETDFIPMDGPVLRELAAKEAQRTNSDRILDIFDLPAAALGL